jgi:orotidine-5'-phosphate decarboxylase
MKGFYLAADIKWRNALNLLDSIGGLFAGVKTHMLTDPAAKDRIRMLRHHGAKTVWVDIKAHDTPDTVAGRAQEMKDAGADFMTVHASGGVKMMRKAVETGIGVYAVVFLTSLTEEEFARYYQPNATANMIQDAMEAKVAGFICPPTMVASMREQLKRFNRRVDIISPGTRFIEEGANDQQQIETPGVTVANGADYLVIGRMVTATNNPQSVMERLQAEVSRAMRSQDAQT